MKKVFLLLCLLTSAFLTFACSSFAPDNGEYINGWKYAIGSGTNHFMAYPGGITSGNFAGLIPGKIGFLWLRKDFVFPKQLEDKQCSVLLGRIIMADETYFNGELIGRGGKFPPHYFNDWNRYRNYTIPHWLVRHNQTNTLLIHVYANADGGIVGPILLDETETINNTEDYFLFMNTQSNAVVAFLILILAWFHLIIYRKRPNDKENLYYIILCIAAAVYQTNFFITTLPGFYNLNLDYLLYQKIIFSSQFFMFFALAHFLKHFLRRPNYKSVNNLTLAITLVPTLILMVMPDYRTFFQYRFYVQGIIFLYVVYTLIIIVRYALQKSRNYRIILFFISVVAGSILYDLIFHVFAGNLKAPFLAGIGFAVFLVGISGIMINRFARYQNELEELNISLEEIVTERTKDLRSANNELMDINHKLNNTQQRLMKAATTDYLTGLYNRQELQKKINEEQARIDRHQKKNPQDITLLFIDLDNFKYYNDLFGHKLGDILLEKFADILRKVVRTEDIITRFGGDEFVVLLLDANRHGAIPVAERIYYELEQARHFTDTVYQFAGGEVLSRSTQGFPAR